MFSYAKFRELLKEKQKKIKNLKTMNSGLSLYIGESLSPGCLACKRGTWLCIFVTERCNLNCIFCPQLRPKFEISLEQPEDIEESLLINSTLCYDIHCFEYALSLKKEQIDGISYSGGEPFLVIPKIIKLAEKCNSLGKGIYQWIYTNGLLVTEDSLKQLRDLNIVEIRFNWAATHFNEIIFKNMELAGKYMKKVVVEIPMYHPRVLDILPKLKTLADIGVSQINCAELYINEENRQRLNIPEAEVYKYPEYGELSPYWSRLLTYDLMFYVQEQGIKITVNDCSNDAKTVQKLSRAANVMNL